MSEVSGYLDAVVAACEAAGCVASVVVFGSVVTGGFAGAISDVDLLLVLRDDAPADAAGRLAQRVTGLEARHGLGKPAPGRPSRLRTFADRITANQRSFFICRRADLLSGEPARILGIPRSQAVFVDGVAVPSIVGSARTLAGEELLEQVPLRPIRRRDVALAAFSLANQALFSAAVYPLLPEATKYSMDALKRSIHNCYFTHHARPAALAEEVAFFRARLRMPVLDELLERRAHYRPSLLFTLRCAPAILRLHLHTALRNSFPRPPRPQ
jgi:predicted nucleotidyltransferase